MIIADLLAAVRNDRSNLVRLLDKWSLKMETQGSNHGGGAERIRKILHSGPLRSWLHFGHLTSIERRRPAKPSIIVEIQISAQTWTSIAILCNPKMGPSRPSQLSRASKPRGRFGIIFRVENEQGDAPVEVQMKTKTLAGLAVGWPRASTAVFFCPWLGA